MSRRGRTLDGPEGPVRIDRAEGGVLDVFAATAAGRAFGLGWGHAQDRIVQMDVLRIAGKGRAAELLQGTPGLVQQDRFVRRRGFWRAALEQTPRLSPASRAIAEAYAAGINAWQASEPRPIELVALGAPSAPWRPADSVLIALLQSYLGLAQSQEVTERFIVHAARSGTAEDLRALKALFAPHLDELDVALLADLVLAPLELPIDPLCAAAFRGMVASNAVAIPGSRTLSGSPIVAGEPHLDTTQIPPAFHEAVLRGPDTLQAGVTVPGVPGVLAGRWTRVAAAITYGFIDQLDYFVEDVSLDGVRRGDERAPVTRIEERVRRKGSQGIDTVVVHRTELGLLHGAPAAQPQRLLALSWVLDGRGLEDAFALPFAMETAHDVDAARAILARFPQSFQYTLGDVEGRTGLQQCGHAPRRAAGHSGLNPQPGWDRSRWWDGALPPDALVGFTRPAHDRRVVVTANETTNPPGGRPVATLGLSTDRRDRIAALLDADLLDRDALRAVHTDRVSLSGRRMLAVVRPYLPDSREGRLLAAWDGTFDPSLEAPSLFERLRATWLLAVHGPLFDRAREVCLMPTEHPPSDGDPLDRPVLWSESNSVTTNVPSFEAALLDPASPSLGGRDWGEVLRAAIAQALSGPARPWARVNSVARSWFLFSAAPAWSVPLVSTRVSLPGTSDTPEQGRIHRIAGRVATVAPVWRMVADLGEPAIHTALAGSPSDRLLDPQRSGDLRRFRAYVLKRIDLQG